MKKSELRVWALRTHVPDEWWVDVNGEVSKTVVTLDQAFQRAEGSPEAYIIHASHAEETENPHWIRMGAENQADDPFGVPSWVCANCGFSFETPNRKGKKITVCEILGYILILPGVVMTVLRRRKTRACCPRCGSTRIVKGNSKAGQALLSR